MTNFGAATSVFKLLAAPPSYRARVSRVGLIYIEGDTRDVRPSRENPWLDRFWGWIKVQLGFGVVLGPTGLGFGPWPFFGLETV